MIYEFDSDPDCDSERGVLKIKWQGKLSVDLTWVAGAQPYSLFGVEPPVCAIMMAGSGQWRPIRYPYEEFMRLWVAARKGASPSKP